MKYDYMVFIGRFQPFHLGHKEVVDRALKLGKKVIILVGGFGKARSPRNPWTFDERRGMIRSVYQDNRVIIQPIRDYTYNDNLWLEQIQNVVRATILDYGTIGGSPKIGLIGCNKDATSYYINLFPQWGNESVDFVNPINATDIRYHLFEDTWQGFEQFVPSPIVQNDDIRPVISTLRDEYTYYENYKKQHSKNPYPTQHLTADACVIQSGHILLVKRRSMPGRGLWALPGGFKHDYETFRQAALRELREETKIKVPEPVLNGSITETFIADSPHRSERGTVVSQVFKMELKPGPLPKVVGSDDAEKATWVPLCDVREDKLFEDHFHIIRELAR